MVPAGVPEAAPGFLHTVGTDYSVEFERELIRRGFVVLRLRADDESEMFAAVGRLFEFPDCYGGSGWDSAWDCFTDVELPARAALFWERADDYAARDLKSFAEACHVLSELFETVAQQGKQVEVVLLGDGPSFDRP